MLTWVKIKYNDRDGGIAIGFRDNKIMAIYYLHDYTKSLLPENYFFLSSVTISNAALSIIKHCSAYEIANMEYHRSEDSENKFSDIIQHFFPKSLIIDKIEAEDIDTRETRFWLMLFAYSDDSIIEKTIIEYILDRI